MAEHDQLFKRTFRVPKHAAGELRSVLPSAVRDAIDFDSLELVQSDVVGQRLNERFNDALFRAKFHGRPGYVWLVLEHQSKPDRFMVLRLLDHIVRSWVELVRREPKRKSLPPIACVVVHHGKRGWTAPTSLHDLIEKPAVAGLAHLVPGFHIVVDDLVDQSDEALKARPLGVSTSRRPLGAARCQDNPTLLRALRRLGSRSRGFGAHGTRGRRQCDALHTQCRRKRVVR